MRRGTGGTVFQTAESTRMAAHGLGGVVVEGLRKQFGSVVALDGIELVVPAGSVGGLLGPNGAGKTTAIRILTTLMQADAGRATVSGFDVATQPHEVRSVISLTGQYAAVDEDLTGRENLVMIGRLGRLGRRASGQRADDLLERFALATAAARLVRSYSGGMRRRLDLAASLVVPPQVLFLDEPTTGLDPPSRQELWEVVRELRGDGTTIVLTTQYLEEADLLADRISVVDHGRIVADGTSDELKARVGGEVLELRSADHRSVARAAAVVTQKLGIPLLDISFDADRGRASIPLATGSLNLFDAVRLIEAEGLEVDDLGLRRASLDDVFLALTGGFTARAADPDYGPDLSDLDGDDLDVRP